MAMNNPASNKGKPRGQSTTEGKRVFGDPNKLDLTESQLKEIKRGLDEGRVKKEAEQKAAFQHDGMEIRALILHATLHIEATVKRLLSELIGVQLRFLDQERIPFAKQIAFLEAVGSLNKPNRESLDAFRQVRNKFIHQLEVNSYVKCYENLDSPRKTVFNLIEVDAVSRIYNIESKNDEATLKWGTNLLIQQVTVICTLVETVVIERMSTRVRGELSVKFFRRITQELGQDEGPFGRMSAKVLHGEPMYTRDQVVRILHDTFTDVSALFKKIGEEVRDEHLKALDRDGHSVVSKETE